VVKPGISGCDGVSDLSPLAALQKLQSLDMTPRSAVSDLAPRSNGSLETLT
jgi:hypothetical protein